MSGAGVRFLFWLRLVLLVGLLGVFAHALLSSLLAEYQLERRDLRTLEGGADPGIRVLLRNRATKSRSHERLRLIALQGSWLFSPDDPGNSDRHIALAPQQEIAIWPGATGGLMLNLGDGQSRHWPVERLRLMPSETTPDVEAIRHPFNRSPRRYEAADHKAVFALGERRYRGSVDILRESARNMLVINSLPIEAYIAGVVPAEMSPSWDVEALRAQAVCARSYAFARQLELLEQQRLYDLVDTVMDQAYHGEGQTSAEVQWAITETTGQVLTFRDLPFSPYFCASSGGRTASVEQVFPGSTAADGRTSLSAVMPAVADEYCQIGADMLGYTQADNSRWEKTVSIAPATIRKALIDHLRTLGIDKRVGFIQDLRVTRRINDRIAEIVIDTDGEDFPMSGSEFRSLIGAGTIRSTLWSADSPRDPTNTDGDRYVITTYGFGHGVGMSQVSAYAMARRYGMNYRLILDFFYVGAEIRKMW